MQENEKDEIDENGDGALEDCRERSEDVRQVAESKVHARSQAPVLIAAGHSQAVVVVSCW